MIYAGENLTEGETYTLLLNGAEAASATAGTGSAGGPGTGGTDGPGGPGTGGTDVPGGPGTGGTDIPGGPGTGGTDVPGVPGTDAPGGTDTPSTGGTTQGCYVATAVYGSYDCPEVWTLRRFRDKVLAKSWYGRLFIRLYYAVSPTAVKLFGGSRWFRDFWRTRLDGMVDALQADGFASTPYNDRAW